MENIVSSFWNKNKIILKAFLIGFLTLLLLIPTLLISNLVTERQERQQAAVGEINAHWAGSQTINGPVIGIPYKVMETSDNNTRTVRKWAFFLPSRLDITAQAAPEQRYRGIYKTVVYTTTLHIKGEFDSLHLAELNIPAEDLLLNEAAVFFDISDVQGLKENFTLHFAGKDLDMVPARFSNDQFKSALSAALPAAVATAHDAPLQFSADLSLKGTGNLLFIPSGKETRVKIASSWPDPSFAGGYLPDERQVGPSGFSAEWRVLYLNRNFPQQWKDAVHEMDGSAFGVSFIVPVNAYQQTMRSAKYAVLIILLTFTAFLLIEWIYSRPIHSLQYVLVGAALCLFYTLLLSLSEYTGFNPAYGIAAGATIMLITWYVRSILGSGKMAGFIASLLVLQYGFIFTLIQLQDYALLLGSIGLFLTLGTVMYFSRKIRWN